MSPEALLGIYVSIGLFILGSATSVFSADIRRWMSSMWLSVSSRRAEKYNRTLDKKISEIQDLSSNPVKMQAQFWAELFFLLVALAVVLFFAGLAYADIAVPYVFVGLLYGWVIFIANAGRCVNLAFSVAEPGQAVEYLESKKKNRSNKALEPTR